MAERKEPQSFEPGDLHVLAERVYADDPEATADWYDEHVHTHRDAHGVMLFVCIAISKIFPVAFTEGVVLGEGQFWALQVSPQASGAEAVVGQLITASLNADWNTVNALIDANLVATDEHHVEVLVKLLQAFGDGMRAATAAGEQKVPDDAS